MNTSYFANLKNIDKFKLGTPVSISIAPPRWYTGAKYFPLAPSRILLLDYRRGLSNDAYIEIFRKQLDKLDPVKVYSEIRAEYGPNPVFLCFEKPGDFCHRRLVADWFEDTMGILVSELPDAAYYRQLREANA